MAARDTNSKGGWQLKRVNSITGPAIGFPVSLIGTDMIDAIDQATSVTDQTEILWKGPESFCPQSKC